MIELRHIIYLPEVGKLEDLIKQDVKAIVDSKGNLYRILSANRVEKINFKNDFTFTDFLTGATYTVQVKDGKCCPKPSPCPPKQESLFQVSTYLYNLNNLTSGPITLHKREDLNFWSTGAIVMTAQQGSVDVEFELRNQIVAAREPNAAVDFAGYTSNGIFYNSLDKKLYLYNGNGTFTLVDTSGAVSVLINQSTFVDPVYGSLTGVNDDLTAAFATLAQGVAAAAVAPRTIYVQPGTYIVTTPLVLQSNITWYFSEGAVVNSTATSLFTDNGQTVSTSITGYGQFNSTGAGGSILNLTGLSTILFEGQSATMSTAIPANMFEFASNGLSAQTTIIKIPTITNSNTSGSAFNLTSGINLITVDSSIISAPTIVRAGSLANGNFDCNCPLLYGTAGSVIGNNLTAGAMFVNQANAFQLNINAQNITSESGTQMINVSTTVINTSPSITNINAQLLNCYGGILWAQGFNNASSILFQPNININIDTIQIPDGSLEIDAFNVNLANLTIESNFYLKSRLDIVSYDVNLLDGSSVILNIDRFSTVGRAFNVSNVTPFVANVTSLTVNSSTITCFQQLLLTTNVVSVELNSGNIQCLTSTVNLAAIATTGVVPLPPPISNVQNSVIIRADLLSLSGTGIDNITRVNIINHTAGVLNMDVVFYAPTGNFMNAIYIGPSLVANNLKIGTVGSIEDFSTFLLAEGSVNLDIGTVACGVINPLSVANAFTIATTPNNLGVTGKIETVVMYGLGNAFELSVSGRFNGTIGQIIFVSGVGNVIYMIGNSSFSADVNLINVDTGNILFTSSSGNVNINFREMNSNASISPLNLIGTGRIQLTGQVITFGDIATAYYIYAANTQQVYMNVELINTGLCDYIIYAQDNSLIDINFDTITSNNTFSIAAFYADDNSIMKLTGNQLSLASSLSTADAFITNVSAFMTIDVQRINFGSLNFIAYTLVNSTMNLTYDTLTTNNPGCQLLFNTTTTSDMNVNGRVTSVYGQGTGFSLVRSEDNSTFIGTFGQFTVNSLLDAAFEVTDNASLTVTAENISSPGTNLSTSSTSSVWVRSDAWSTTNASNVYIYASVAGNPVTVGGYMTTNGGNYNIEYDIGAAAVSLRLLSSILVSTTNSIFSPLILPNVSLAPSSATMPANGVTLLPAAAFFVDPGVF